MPADLTFDESIAALGASAAAFRRLADQAGPLAAVPTCPGWDVRTLIAHQGRVHRWATSTLRGLPDRRDQDFADGMRASDQLAWFDAGLDELLRALRTASGESAPAPFLADAPSVRPFWARRQAHETMIHAVDALTTSFGGIPPADRVTAELPISTAFAADGIDELLCGFLPSGRTKLYAEQPYVLLVETSDTAHAWTVRVRSRSVGRPSTMLGRDGEPDATFSGTAVELYLGLWNRGDGPTVTGPSILEGRDLLREWRSLAVV